MTHVIDNRPVLDFFQDVFESDELSINIIILNMSDGAGHIGRGRRQPVTIPATQPPTRGGTVVPRKIKNGTITRRGRHIERG